MKTFYIPPQANKGGGKTLSGGPGPPDDGYGPECSYWYSYCWSRTRRARGVAEAETGAEQRERRDRRAELREEQRRERRTQAQRRRAEIRRKGAEALNCLKPAEFRAKVRKEENASRNSPGVRSYKYRERIANACAW